MSDKERYTDPEGHFDLVVPRGWSAGPDEDGEGVEVWSEEGAGTLHLMAFTRGGDEFPDPAEELYAFLDERGVELEEDEVEDVPLEDGAEMALCEFASEDEEEEDGGALFWIVGVATAPGALVFATYFCPAGSEEAERELVRKALGTLRVRGGE